jgi:imidazolonepropionase-like amidohydrolase
MGLVLFRNAQLLDRRGPISPTGSVLVEDDRIREVSSRPIKAAGASVIDCGGRTLMPGLIDCHVHVFLSEVNLRYLESVPLTLMTARAAGLMRAMLDRGFTTVRDAAGADWGIREGVALGHLPGPACSSLAGPVERRPQRRAPPDRPGRPATPATRWRSRSPSPTR